MRLRLERVTRPFARAVQRAYARVVRRGAARVPRPEAQGPVGGSLPQEVQRADLVKHTRWGFVYSPSRLGTKFRVWWSGSKRQRARGRQVPVDVDRLADELADELARQVRAEDRRRR